MILAETQRRGGLAPWIALLGIAGAVGVARGETATPSVVLKDLHQPCGVAVRPGGTADRYEVFVAESGAGRVLRWSNLTPKRTAVVVSGFQAAPAADSLHQTGPLALWFLDPGLLALGTTCDASGDLVRTYELPENEKALDAAVTNSSVPNSSVPDAGKLAGAACFALVRTQANGFVPDRLVLAVRDADGHARLMKARVQAGAVGDPQPFGVEQGSEPPRAVAMSKSGRIVVGDAGGGLTFYNPIDGKVELALATDLKELVSLAFSPATGSLYAADFAGGIYRIDDTSQPGHPACQAVKVADVTRPTALDFAPDGGLYVVTFGDAGDDGTLTMITSDL
jgi:DNA-binding beta-propeller fold protein YncE